jgi:two-component system, chemotaxis family, protein-glutamate methylesterase/glutaminase
MAKVRVLIVDDSVVIRRLLTDILSAETDIEVVGSAANASLALQRLATTNPDVVTLDVEMPDMSGLDLLAEIRRRQPKLPVIMFSSQTQRAAAVTLEALARGATDYVPKPNGTGGLDASRDQVRRELLPKIRALGVSVARAQSLREQAPAARVKPLPSVARGVEVLAIGSSTGGPNALAELFRLLPATLPVPVLVVQHMPPLFTRMLAERLTATCPIPFREACAGDVLEPGKAYVAPGDHHMRVTKSGGRVLITLDQSAPENSCRPAVDPLFRSVAEVFGDRCLAVVLTGMGQDGLVGCEVLAAKGAQIIVQDEESSVVWGMPGFVARAGLAQSVLPLAELPAEILRRVARASGAWALRLAEENARVS